MPHNPPSPCLFKLITWQRQSCPVLAGVWHVIDRRQSWTQTWGEFVPGACKLVNVSLEPSKNNGWCCPVRRGQGRASQGDPERALLLLSTAGLPCMTLFTRQVKEDNVCAALHATFF